MASDLIAAPHYAMQEDFFGRARVGGQNEYREHPERIASPLPGFAISKKLSAKQQLAIDLLKESLLAGKKRIILKLPTGGGKTIIASAIIQSARSKGKRVIFCVNAISLIDQTVQKFKEEGIDGVGVMQGNHMLTDSSMPVQVCSVQTLARRKLPNADLVIIDEAHNFFKFHARWMQDWPNVPFIGLSATPYTKGLGKYYEDVITVATTQDLIDDGWLSKFVVYVPNHPDLKDVRVVAGDYQEDDLAKVMDTKPLTADVVKSWLELGQNRPTLCYAVTRAHAKNLQKDFIEAGVPCEYMDAFTEREDRAVIADKFKKGEIKVVCNVGVLTTGIDWDVRCISLVRPTKSDMLFQQIIGRGLRTAPGKDHCIILDHSDTHSKKGFVTDVDEKYEGLDDGKPNTSSVRKKKEPPLPKECPSCHFLRPARVSKCPACGFKPEQQSDVEVVDGELVVMSKSKAKANRQYSTEEKARFFGELKYYANAKGFKEGWAANKYREKFGVWPNAHRGASMVTTSEEVLGWIRHSQIKWAKSNKR